MNISTTPSGLILATDKPIVPPAPPEHPVRAVIRKHLAALADELDGFEQTTHGHIRLPPGGIGSVAEEIVNCYDEPRAFSISSLSQEIRVLLKEAGGAD